MRSDIGNINFIVDTNIQKKLQNPILKIAVPSPIRGLFDYAHTSREAPRIGSRIEISFGHQKSLVGILVESSPQMASKHKLKTITKVLDEQPALDQEILNLCQWCASYYHYPLGEVCQLALPALLRKVGPAPKPVYRYWQLSEQGLLADPNDFKRAPKQQSLLTLLQTRQAVTSDTLKAEGVSNQTLQALAKKLLVECHERESLPTEKPDAELLKETKPHLTEEQNLALAEFKLDQFNSYLLDGVTGSGKTEVYLQTIEQALQAGQQALVLVPEIGLTPQTVSRFERRFNANIAALHSKLTDKQRFDIWQSARQKHIDILIGTRSSIFTPLPALGLIVVDEEHDLSYKQQEGVRYSARDLAIVRAQKRNIPLILGSATPALESLHNAVSGRYQHLRLTSRANNRSLPQIYCEPSEDNELSTNSINTIKQALNQEQQVLIFINRRGYAPTLMCLDCGWISQCPRCDSRMTLHKQINKQWLHCHHCDYQISSPRQCPNCHSQRLAALGSGTQRSEEQLNQHFANTPIIRIDRDSVARKGQLEAAFEQINSGTPCILVGTQMLAKGHHFARLGLTVILGLDQAFFSSDFRGAERMGQLLTQVSGRTGREHFQGKVIIQSQFSEHPLLQQLLKQNYHDFAQYLLDERQLTQMPPFQHLALIRCHAQQATIAEQFLQQVRQRAEQLFPAHAGLQYLGPYPAAMEKRNNRFHYLLQIKTANRQQRQKLFDQLCSQLEKMKQAKGLHWLIDIDPQEF